MKKQEEAPNVTPPPSPKDVLKHKRNEICAAIGANDVELARRERAVTEILAVLKSQREDVDGIDKALSVLG